jgi:hypothetical protein
MLFRNAHASCLKSYLIEAIMSRNCKLNVKSVKTVINKEEVYAYTTSVSSE